MHTLATERRKWDEFCSQSHRENLSIMVRPELTGVASDSSIWVRVRKRNPLRTRLYFHPKFLCDKPTVYQNNLTVQHPSQDTIQSQLRVHLFPILIMFAGEPFPKRLSHKNSVCISWIPHLSHMSPTPSKGPTFHHSVLPLKNSICISWIPHPKPRVTYPI
jgi:hypothetical protein